MLKYETRERIHAMPIFTGNMKVFTPNKSVPRETVSLETPKIKLLGTSTPHLTHQRLQLRHSMRIYRIIYVSLGTVAGKITDREVSRP